MSKNKITTLACGLLLSILSGAVSCQTVDDLIAKKGASPPPPPPVGVAQSPSPIAPPSIGDSQVIKLEKNRIDLIGVYAAKDLSQAEFMIAGDIRYFTQGDTFIDGSIVEEISNFAVITKKCAGKSCSKKTYRLFGGAQWK